MSSPKHSKTTEEQAQLMKLFNNLDSGRKVATLDLSRGKKKERRRAAKRAGKL